MFDFLNKMSLDKTETEKAVDTGKQSDTEKSGVKSPFRLPIQYLDASELHELDNTVATDLELSIEKKPNDNSEPLTIEKTMYHYLMNPKTPFEENMIPLWKNHYTTNTKFLKETQDVIKSVGSLPISSPDYETVMTIWKDTKEDPYFLERYSYMELEMFRWVNHMPSFLQASSIINMGSPILSFLVPFIMFFMPFFIVKIQGHPITFSLYLSVLKDISRHHFIGKMLSSAQEFSLSNMIYLLILAGLYIYQIYQNYMACTRFYTNINKINTQICLMQEYLAYTIRTMSSFEGVIKDSSTYNGFRQDLAKYRQNLQQLEELIRNVRPFQPSFSKIGEIGTLLGCYYELFSNDSFSEALQYSYSFHGYVQNMYCINENLMAGLLACADFDKKDKKDRKDKKDKKDKKNKNKEDKKEDEYKKVENCVIKDGYYPALINESFVTNDTDLTKNMVITGPNAAGKTTFLKTTMLNIIFTQQFGCGFYSACSLKPYTHLHSYLNIPDTSGRDSLFQAESRRCKEIIDHVVLSKEEDRHFSIFDELYSGTNPVEATKSAYAFLIWLQKMDNVDFILTTHYVDICTRFKEEDVRIENWKMDAIEDEMGDIEYTYKLVEGISTIQGAVKVLRDMDYPEDILQGISDYDSVKK